MSNGSATRNRGEGAPWRRPPSRDMLVPLAIGVLEIAADSADAEVRLDAERRGSSIGLIMIDLDRFKQLNDTHGHGAGDTILREVAETIVSSIRATDIACRYGGEELVVLLPDCGLEMTAAKAEQIRHRIANQTFSGGISVTASFGIAALPEISASARALMADVDTALYQAKTGGRNRVAVTAAQRAVALIAEAA